MSLQSDLARNRAIFEALTGATAAAADSPERSSVRVPRGVPLQERAESARLEQQLAEESPPEPARNFSLAYGSRPAPVTTSIFEAPDDIGYPELGESVPRATLDPIESLYHQLDVQARMSSQLSQEEEF